MAGIRETGHAPSCLFLIQIIIPDFHIESAIVVAPVLPSGA